MRMSFCGVMFFDKVLRSKKTRFGLLSKNGNNEVTVVFGLFGVVKRILRGSRFL